MTRHVYATDQARRVARSEFITRVFVVAMAGALIAAVVTLAQVRETQLEGTPLGKTLVKSAERILECTEPGTAKQPAGECYQRNQQRTAKAVGDIGRINVLAVVCAADVDPSLPFKTRLAQVSKCVADGLAADPPKP